MTPRLSYIICTTARSGSNLLSSTLWQTGVAGRPEEFFVPGYRDAFLRYNQLGVRDYREYVRAIITRATTPNGVFGTTLHAVQSWLFIARAGYSEDKKFDSFKEAIEAVFPHPRYIFLTRNDKVAQAVSHYKAVMTGEWRRFTDTVPDADKKLTFSQYGIKKSLHDLERSDAYWETFFSTHKLSPLRLTYEELVGDFAKTMQSVFTFLELPPDTAVPQPITKKISDGRSTEWATEFLRLEKSDPVLIEPTSGSWPPV